MQYDYILYFGNGLFEATCFLCFKPTLHSSFWGGNTKFIVDYFDDLHYDVQNKKTSKDTHGLSTKLFLYKWPRGAQLKYQKYFGVT